MLVLTRKEGDAIRIGDDILVRVVRSGSNVRLGIVAPRDVNVVREELIDRDKEQAEPANRRRECDASC